MSAQLDSLLDAERLAACRAADNKPAKPDDGGPAFPPMHDPDTHPSGMTLRDYFAAKAMQGMLACPVQPQSGVEVFARDAYAVADAMLQARKVQQ